MSTKKLLILGGSRYIIPVIETAHRLGVEVITADYLPDNIAHRYSDRYVNVSVVDHAAVLRAAEGLGIDGIMSFACDPGVVTAAYVAEQMGLPFQGSYEATCILQDKGRFRQFLTEHGFNCPRARRYTDEDAPFKDIDYFDWPVIVKPVDSAGSKGVTRVDRPDGLKEAIAAAIRSSLSGAFIVEEFLTFEGYHSSTDPFSVNGKLEFITYSDQLFDEEADNPYTPALIIWPSSMKIEHQETLTQEIQRLLNLLHMDTGIYNIESCVANNKPYIMEVSPRGGGCKIAEIQKMAYGVDLIENEVRKAIGFPLTQVKQTNCDGCWCEMVVHAEPGCSGLLKDVFINPVFESRHLKLEDISARSGDMVMPFTGANMSIGDIFLRFDSREELDEAIRHKRDWLKISLIDTNGGGTST